MVEFASRDRKLNNWLPEGDLDMYDVALLLATVHGCSSCVPMPCLLAAPLLVPLFLACLLVWRCVALSAYCGVRCVPVASWRCVAALICCLPFALIHRPCPCAAAANRAESEEDVGWVGAFVHGWEDEFYQVRRSVS